MTRIEPSFRERTAAQELLIGSFVFSHDASVVRVADAAGIDFLLLDYEHGLFSPELTARYIDQALHSSVAIFVRCTMEQLHQVGALFDRGLTGVIVAGASSVSDVKCILNTVKFWPEGERGLNPFVPATQFGQVSPQEFMRTANEKTNVWVLVENQALLSQLDEVCKLPHVDGIFLGPYDLSISLGLPGQLDHPHVVQTLSDTIQTVQTKGKAVGIFAKQVSAAQTWVEQGVSLLALGFDWQTLQAAWRSNIEQLRQHK